MGAALAAALCAVWPATAAAAPSVRVIPPPMVGQFNRTADPQPVFGIEAADVDGGDHLVCYPESSVDSARPCGPALPGCTAQLCASYRPDAPLPDGEHDFSVDLLDAAGHSEIFPPAGMQFIVDTTPPPKPALDGPFGSAFRPRFSVALADDLPAYSVSDGAQCSLSRLGRPADWRPCAASWSQRIPHRRRDYRFEVQAVDDFGRTGTPAVEDFNPVPCTIRARRTSISRLIRRGLSVRVRCALVPAAAVTLVYPRHGYIGLRTFRAHGRRHWTAHARVRVLPVSAPAVRQLRRLPLRAIVAPVTPSGGAAYGKPWIARLKLR